MDSIAYLIVPLLQGFEWFDESLQLSLRANGWPSQTRPQSMIMMHVQLDIVRPADIARSLRLTRQAVHSTIAGMVESGVLELVDDPVDKRIKIVRLTALGTAMRHDAQRIVREVTVELGKRIGKAGIKRLSEEFAKDWGDPVVCKLDDADPRAEPPRTPTAAKRGRPLGGNARNAAARQKAATREA